MSWHYSIQYLMKRYSSQRQTSIAATQNLEEDDIKKPHARTSATWDPKKLPLEFVHENWLGNDTIGAMRNGKLIGRMSMYGKDNDWGKTPGEIEHIQVQPRYRGKGVARAMAEHAQSLGFEPKHSPSLTDDGTQFAQNTNLPHVWTFGGQTKIVPFEYGSQKSHVTPEYYISLPDGQVRFNHELAKQHFYEAPTFNKAGSRRSELTNDGVISSHRYARKTMTRPFYVRTAGDVIPFPQKSNTSQKYVDYRGFNPLGEMSDDEKEFEITGRWPGQEDSPDVNNSSPSTKQSKKTAADELPDLVSPPKKGPFGKTKIQDMTPDQLTQHQAWQSQVKDYQNQWNQRNPLNSDNIVEHYDAATPEEISNGMNWYKDAHEIAKTISNKSGLTPNQVAGLIAVYSPQTHWATNMQNAAHSALTRKAVTAEPYLPGGKGNMVSASQAKAAQRIIDGEDWRDVVAGPKIRDFASLIEHGDDDDPNEPRAVIDRHALGVSRGTFADEHAYNGARLSGKKVYREHANAYRDAAARISERTGQRIAPHQLQAITWLTRQRRNAEGGYSDQGRSEAQKRIAEQNTQSWNDYIKDRIPEAIGMAPGVGFSQNLVGRHTAKKALWFVRKNK